MVQMFGRMARVPVTARQKFNEAAYFYNTMLKHQLNVSSSLITSARFCRHSGV